MMNFFGFILIVIAILMIMFREHAGNMLGQAGWMEKLGGVYMVMIYVGMLLFFLGLIMLFGLTEVALGPIFNFIPGVDIGVKDVEVNPFAF